MGGNIETIISLILFCFGTACLSIFIEACFDKGMIFRKYYAVIRYNLYLKKKSFFYKPLGGCIYCFSAWVFIGLFSISYFMNEATVEFKYENSKIIKEGKSCEPVFKETKTLPLCERSLWNKYRNLVWKITEKQNLKKLPNFDKRGRHNYHLDHKVSIWYGYKNKLDPKLIGSIDNLEFIPWRENFKKSIRCNFKKAKCLQTVIFV